MIETVGAPCRSRGRLKQRPKELLADKSYDSKRFGQWLRLMRNQANDLYQRRVRKHLKRGGRPTKVRANYAEHRKLVRLAYYLSNFRGFSLLAFVLLLPLPYPLCRFDPGPAGVS